MHNNAADIQFNESFEITFPQADNMDMCRIAHDKNVIHRNRIIHFALIPARAASAAMDYAQDKGMLSSEPKVAHCSADYHHSVRADRSYICTIEVKKFTATKEFSIAFMVGNNRVSGIISGSYIEENT